MNDAATDMMGFFGLFLKRLVTYVGDLFT